MYKLKANTRFLNVISGKILDKDDEFNVESKSDFDYFTKHKIASLVKSDATEKEKKSVKK